VLNDSSEIEVYPWVAEPGVRRINRKSPKSSTF
jgi:hypothetical protein